MPSFGIWQKIKSLVAHTFRDKRIFRRPFLHGNHPTIQYLSQQFEERWSFLLTIFQRMLAWDNRHWWNIFLMRALEIRMIVALRHCTFLPTSITALLVYPHVRSFCITCITGTRAQLRVQASRTRSLSLGFQRMPKTAYVSHRPKAEGARREHGRNRSLRSWRTSSRTRCPAVDMARRARSCAKRFVLMGEESAAGSRESRMAASGTWKEGVDSGDAGEINFAALKREARAQLAPAKRGT